MVDRFHTQSKIPYSEMLFFDDEERNIIDLSKIGKSLRQFTICIIKLFRHAKLSF